MNTPNKKPIKENFTSNYILEPILIFSGALLITTLFIIFKYIFQFSSKSALVISFILPPLSIFAIINVLVYLTNENERIKNSIK